MTAVDTLATPNAPGDPEVGDPPQTGPAEESFDADVIGVDVVDFSRFTQRLIDAKGAGAAEEVMDILGLGFRAIADRLEPYGFTAIDSLGDGIILARKIDGVRERDVERWLDAAETAFASAALDLRVRAAHASGRLNLCRIGGWQGRWDTVATGPAIAELHLAMARRRRRPDPPAGSNPQGNPARPRNRSTARSEMSIAEIRKLAVVFAAIKLSDKVLAAPLESLQAIAILGQRLSEACGGRLEKISHDDKGLLLDFSFARARGVGGTALDSALDFILELRPLLTNLSLAPSFGLAEGFVYRGPLAVAARVISIMHGPAVNLSAKLSATSGSDLALEWDAAQRLAQRLPDFAAPSEFKLQNEFRCVGVRLADTPRPLSVSAKSNELVGRETELGILASALERLSQGDGRLIVLSGQRGIGKSRLLEAFRNSFVPARNAIWLRSDPRDAAEYMSFWRDLTGSLALVLSDGRADGLARSLTIALSAAEIPADLHAVVEDVMPASGLLHTERLAALEGISRRELLERAILAIAIAAAKKKPTLICLDDAQWIDEASCRLLAELLPLAPELLVVLAHRDGDYPHLDRLKRPVDLARTTMIALGPLGSLEIARISRNAGAGERHPDADFGQIFELSGGNPFYAEQIAHWLEGSADNSVSTLARTYTGPKSLDRVLDERLDSLSPPESRIVRTLSIFDRPLSVTALNALASAIPVRAMAEALTSLTTNAFVKFADAGGQRPTAGLTINHRLLADAVIAHIPPSEAQLLHASAARFFGRLRAAKEDPSVTDALIAHHWNEAGEARRAALKLGKAGDAVLYAGAPELAIEHFNKALKLIANGAIGATPRVAGWYAGRAVAQWAKGEMAHALDDAAQALSLLDNRLGGPSWLPRAARAGLARLRRTVLAAAGLGLVPRAARPPLVVVSALRAEMAFFLGEVGTMASAYLSMMAFAHEPRLRARTRARAYLFLGHMATLRPFRFERAAHRAWDAARTLGESVGDSVAASHGYLGEAIWHMSFGRWSQARSQLHSAVELYGDVADPAYNKFVETLLALAANFEGDWRQAQQRFQGLLEVGQRQNNRSTQAWGLYGQVMALTAQARWLEANMLLALAEPIVDSMPDKQSQIICKGLRTQIEYGQARFAGAFERATDCLALAHSLTVNNFGSLEGFAAPAEIILRLSLDDRAPAEIRTAARRNIRRAMKSLERFAWAHPIAQPRLSLCRALAARLHERQSDWRRALHQGLDEARSYGMEFERLKLELERSRSDAPGATND